MWTLADGTFLTGKRLVPELLDECPVNTIRAFFQKCWCYMDAYRYDLISTSVIWSKLIRYPSSKGFNACQTEFAVQKYHSHWQIGALVMMSLGIFDNPV